MLTNNPDSASTFRKVPGDKLSDSYIRDIYKRCRMNLTSDPSQILTPQLVDLGISTIDALDKVSGLSTPATIIQRPVSGAHWMVHNYILGETTAVVVIEEKSD